MYAGLGDTSQHLATSLAQQAIAQCLHKADVYLQEKHWHCCMGQGSQDELILLIQSLIAIHHGRPLSYFQMAFVELLPVCSCMQESSTGHGSQGSVAIMLLRSLSKCWTEAPQRFNAKVKGGLCCPGMLLEHSSPCSMDCRVSKARLICIGRCVGIDGTATKSSLAAEYMYFWRKKMQCLISWILADPEKDDPFSPNLMADAVCRNVFCTSTSLLRPSMSCKLHAFRMR